MAEIEKGLPNEAELKVEDVNTNEIVNIPEEQKEEKDVEITETPDGGAEISFDPNAPVMESTSHFQNLADLLDDSILDPLGSQLVADYKDYRSSRKDWEDTYKNGLDLLGFKYERRTEPFKGASGVTHPVLSEAITQFQAQAYKELLPSDGPVRTQILEHRLHKNKINLKE